MTFSFIGVLFEPLLGNKQKTSQVEEILRNSDPIKFSLDQSVIGFVQGGRYRLNLFKETLNVINQY